MKPRLVILAAGASRRLGECKALVRFGERTVLERLLAAGHCFDSAPPIVVAGAHHAEIAGAAPEGVRLLNNTNWQAGRTGSLQLARQESPGEDLCIAPVDVPLVEASVFEALLARWRSAGAPPRGWLAPSTEGRFGHPLVLGRELLEDLSGWPADRSLRLLRAEAQPLLSVEGSWPEVLDDLDSPADLARLRARNST